MTINISIPNNGHTPELRPRITVFGVGGAGGNAVNNMIQSQLEGVDFVVANTDAQALAQSRSDRRIQLGTTITRGLGAGSRPDVGAAAAEESLPEIMEHLAGSNMVFITAGMGGGTGTGAAPVIARAAREAGILTVGVVTKPFHFEGVHRMRVAESGISDMEQYVDTLIIIPNQNLFRIANEKTTFADAFSMADEVLYSGVRGVTDLMVMPGLINLDFADIRAVMSEMGKAMMGTGEAEGERRALDAAEAAIANPLLDDTTMSGATGVLINITGGKDMTLFEADEAANRIRSEVDPEAHIIFGSTFDDSMEGRIRVSIVATGMDSEAAQHPVRTMLDMPAARATPMFAEKPSRPVEALRRAEALRPVARPPMTVVEMRPVMQELPDTMEAPVAERVEEAVVMAEPESPPIAVAVATTDGALPPAIEQGTAEPFIPSAPVQAGQVSKAQPDPFAAAAMTNGAARPDRQAPAAAAPARAPSLFERVTGTGRAAWGARSARTAEAAPAPTPNRVEPRPMEARPAAARTEAAQPQLGGLDPADRIATSTPEEDLLDIPAFLRRQAN